MDYRSSPLPACQPEPEGLCGKEKIQILSSIMQMMCLPICDHVESSRHTCQVACAVWRIRTGDAEAHSHGTAQRDVSASCPPCLLHEAP